MFWTRVIRQKASLKVIVFSMGLQHSGRKPVETSGVYFGSLKTFLLAVKLENIRIGTSLNILVTHAQSTLIRFQTKTELFLLRIRLSSTLQRQKRSPKPEPFENALRSGAIWERCFLKTLFTSVEGENDAIWKRWRHQNRHDWAPDHSTVSIQNGGQTLPISRQFGRPIYWNAHASHASSSFWACVLRV